MSILKDISNVAGKALHHTEDKVASGVGSAAARVGAALVGKAEGHLTEHHHCDKMEHEDPKQMHDDPKEKLKDLGGLLGGAFGSHEGHHETPFQKAEENLKDPFGSIFSSLTEGPAQVVGGALNPFSLLGGPVSLLSDLNPF